MNKYKKILRHYYDFEILFVYNSKTNHIIVIYFNVIIIVIVIGKGKKYNIIILRHYTYNSYYSVPTRYHEIQENILIRGIVKFAVSVFLTDNIVKQ